MGSGTTRRVFMVGAATLGGVALAGLGIGTGYLATIDVAGTSSRRNEDASVDLTSWINITPANEITIYVPFVEMGQGTHTGLAQLVCEELGLDVSADNVQVTHPQQAMAVHTNWTMFLNERPENMTGPMFWYAKRFMGSMKLSATGGSTAVVASWSSMRRAGAIARDMLEQAAMQKLGAGSEDLIQQHAGFRRRDDGAMVTFGELAELAAAITPSEKITLKQASEFEVIGKPIARIDTTDKITGAARFGIDVRLPNLLYATVRQAPVVGAKIESLDDGMARSMRGVVDVIATDQAAIVIADNTWRALRAVEALEINYKLPEKSFDTESLEARLRAGLDGKRVSQQHASGDVASALKRANQIIEAEYQTPYLAHATMEPMNCTVWWRDDGIVNVWAPTQSAALARQVVESIGGAVEVRVAVTYAGGGFGRRAEKDFVRFAALAAKSQIGKPVQLVWSREEDTTHDVYRPASLARVAAALDQSGRLTGVDAAVATHSVMASFLARNVDGPAGVGSDNTTLEGLIDMPYGIDNQSISACEVETEIPIGFWRTVGHSNNAFFVECIMDECASAARQDPLEYRLAHLDQHHSRHRIVLETLKDKANWHGTGGNGFGRGLALHKSFRSIVAAVVDVRVTGTKQLVLEQVTAVVDCGTVVNPRLVESQIQGGLHFGLTAACFGQMDFVEGRAVQDNFDTYEMLRLNNAPEIVVHLIDSNELPGGVGEPGTPVAAPAMVNAIFAATSERIRRLPVSSAGFSV